MGDKDEKGNETTTTTTTGGEGAPKGRVYTDAEIAAIAKKAAQDALVEQAAAAEAERQRLAAEKAAAEAEVERERKRSEQIAAGGQAAADAVRAELASERAAREAETRALAQELKAEREARALSDLRAHRAKAVVGLRLPELVPVPTLSTTVAEIDAQVAAAKAREADLFGKVRTELAEEVRTEVTRALPKPLNLAANAGNDGMTAADRSELRAIRDPKEYAKRRDEIRAKVREKHGL